jgi:hypothetical protein
MNLLELARFALRGDDLSARQWVKNAHREGRRFSSAPLPGGYGAEVAVAAALAVLFSRREGTAPPAWTKQVRPAESPVYLDPAAATKPRFRARLEEMTPEELRRFNVFGPPGYLDVV